MRRESGLRRRSELRRQSGFTLIEIMVVIAIIGILATMILPSVVGQQEKALRVKAKADIRAISSAVIQYKLENRKYPTTDAGIEALVSGGEGGTSFLSEVPKDPWGNEYNYLYPGQNGDFDVWSFGGDEQEGGEGDGADIGNWNLGSN